MYVLFEYWKTKQNFNGVGNLLPLKKVCRTLIIFDKMIRLKIACYNAHILKTTNRQQFKHALRWYFRQAHFVRFVLKPNEIL